VSLKGVLRGILGAVDRELNATVGGNGGDRRVRRLQRERAKYRDELGKTTSKRPRGTN
jgi:hypothetical protein